MSIADTRLALRRHLPLSRRTALLGLLAGAAVAVPAGTVAAETARPGVRRGEAATNTAAARRGAAPNRAPAAAGRTRRPAEAAAAPAPQPRGAAPALDPPPARPVQRGWAAAPVPARNVQPPRGDMVPQPDLAFGVPGPREFGSSATTRGSDPSPDAREAADRASALPAPGFMLRLPF
jgi:hypothetical protein